MEWKISHLRALEAESIHIFREVGAEFQRPVMLYSIGKDSSVMLRLAQKAFYPGPVVSGYKSSRLNWLEFGSDGSMEPVSSKARKMGVFSNSVTLSTCRI